MRYAKFHGLLFALALTCLSAVRADTVTISGKILTSNWTAFAVNDTFNYSIQLLNPYVSNPRVGEYDYSASGASLTANGITYMFSANIVQGYSTLNIPRGNVTGMFFNSSNNSSVISQIHFDLYSYYPNNPSITDSEGMLFNNVPFSQILPRGFNSIIDNVGGQYTFEVTGYTHAITPAITWPTPLAITYGTALSATQLNATSSMAGTFVYSPATDAVLNAGARSLSVTFTPTDGANYTTATKSVNLTVNKATPAISWSNPPTITYGTALSASQLTATANVPGVFVYTPAAGAVPNAGTQSLGVSFTPTDSSNYTGAAKSVNLAVNKATLMVTATDKSRTYGVANPVFTAVFSGFVNGDAASVVTGSPAFTTPASSTSNVGTYAITPAAGTLVANNYSFSPFNNGTLTVTKATLTVTADNKAKLQGTENPPLTVSYAGFVNGDSAGSLTTQSVASVLTDISSPIGSYPIAPFGGVSANYSFIYVNGVLNVVAESIAPSNAVVTISVE